MIFGVILFKVLLRGIYGRYAMLAWSNYFWLTGHFTKMWQLAGHFQQNDA